MTSPRGILSIAGASAYSDFQFNALLVGANRPKKRAIKKRVFNTNKKTGSLSGGNSSLLILPGYMGGDDTKHTLWQIQTHSWSSLAD